MTSLKGIATITPEKTTRLGLDAGPSDLNSDYGVLIGYRCLQSATTSNGSVCIGREILRNSTSTTNYNNVILGRRAARDSTGAGFSSNVILGDSAGCDIASDDNIADNVLIGSHAGRGTAPSNVVCIGSNAGNLVVKHV